VIVTVINIMNQDDKKRDVKVLNKVINELGEYFDTVQVFVTRHEPATENGTVEYNGGVGNHYARLGHIQSWLEDQKYANMYSFEESDDNDDEEESF
jgi:hypothetical protein